MICLNVFIEINGQMTKVGVLSGNDYRDVSFAYDSEYLTATNAKAISISLPLQKKAFSTEETKAYFESLLPEGFSRKSVANWAKVNEEDYVSILEYLGRECIGAVQVVNGSSLSEGGYKEISNDEIMELAKEGATKSTELLIESHISLAGASGKVGLFYDDKNRKWYKPYGTAASTHIVKQSHVRLDHLVLNEQICMLTASKLKINVPKSFIINTGNANDDEILYAIERYDRVRRDKSQELLSPYRLHQEDFAQALGIISSEKYEIEDKHYLRKMFELVNDFSSNPIEDGLKLWDMIVFNYLIGNTDAHIKNYGLVYSADLGSVRLAPAYDIVCTRIYGNRNDMSVVINGILDCTKVKREDFATITKDLLLGQKIAMEHYDYIYNNLELALKESVAEIEELGFKDAVKVGDRIWKASMVCHGSDVELSERLLKIEERRDMGVKDSSARDFADEMRKRILS